jgi:hypothetical protein
MHFEREDALASKFTYSSLYFRVSIQSNLGRATRVRPTFLRFSTLSDRLTSIVLQMLVALDLKNNLIRNTSLQIVTPAIERVSPDKTPT